MCEYLSMDAKKWRINNGLTLDQLSVRMRYAKSYISEVERGKKPPSGGILMAYDTVSGGVVKPSDFSTSTSTGHQ